MTTAVTNEVSTTPEEEVNFWKHNLSPVELGICSIFWLAVVIAAYTVDFSFCAPLPCAFVVQYARHSVVLPHLSSTRGILYRARTLVAG